jgi:hypothetical protein
MCKLIDTICIRFCNAITFLLEYLCLPLKYLFKPLTNNLQRPYSLCFFFSFFLLITPAILMIVLLIQSSTFINNLETFNLFFYLTLFNLLINYFLVFHIYNIYGLHKLEYQPQVFTVKSFLNFILNFMFKETKLGLIGIYFIAQCFLNIYILIYITMDKNLNNSMFDLPIVVTFTLYAVISNLIFTLGHVVIYLFLLMVLLCKINNSCLCGVVSNNKFRTTISFIDKYLNCFLLFGVYDIERGGIEFNIINNI